MSVTASALCACFEDALRMGCPYATPGETSWSRIAEGVDCSGLFTAAFRHLGSDIYHGSNTIARKHVTGLRRIGSASQLRCGEAVFKWRADGEPGRYAGDGQGNFHHIGLVCSVQPLRIIHASSAAGCVTVDTTAGGWAYAGWLSGVTDDMTNDMTNTKEETSMTETRGMTLRVTASSLRIRAEAGTAAKVVGRLKKGETVQADLLEGGWYRLADGRGWVSGAYVNVLREDQADAAPDALAERIAALEKRVALLEEACA